MKCWTKANGLNWKEIARVVHAACWRTMAGAEQEIEVMEEAKDCQAETLNSCPRDEWQSKGNPWKYLRQFFVFKLGLPTNHSIKYRFVCYLGEIRVFLILIETLCKTMNIRLCGLYEIKGYKKTPQLWSRWLCLMRQSRLFLERPWK